MPLHSIYINTIKHKLYFKQTYLTLSKKNNKINHQTMRPTEFHNTLNDSLENLNPRYSEQVLKKMT